MVHSKDEGDMSTWSAFMVFDKDLDSFKSYEGEVSGEGKSFKVTPLGWNGESKAGSRRQISIAVRWPLGTAEPKLMSLTVNGVPYTCGDGEQSTVS